MDFSKVLMCAVRNPFGQIKHSHTQKPLQPLHLIFYSKKIYMFSRILVGNLYTINLHWPMLGILVHLWYTFRGTPPNITPRFALSPALVGQRQLFTVNFDGLCNVQLGSSACFAHSSGGATVFVES